MRKEVSFIEVHTVLWNSLSRIVTHATILTTFKKNLYSYVLVLSYVLLYVMCSLGYPL